MKCKPTPGPQDTAIIPVREDAKIDGGFSPIQKDAYTSGTKVPDLQTIAAGLGVVVAAGVGMAYLRTSSMRSLMKFDGELVFSGKSAASLDGKFAELFRNARESIGSVNGASGSSTGFVISKSGKFLATHHGTLGAESTIALPSGIYKAGVVASDEKLDLALLQLVPNHAGEQFRALSLSARSSIYGEKVMAAGFPSGKGLFSEFRAMPGRMYSKSSETEFGRDPLSRWEGIRDLLKYIFSPYSAQTSTKWDGYLMKIAGGASGSPVLSRTGEVRGMVAYQRNFGTGRFQVNTTGAVKLDNIKRFLQPDYQDLTRI